MTPSRSAMVFAVLLVAGSACASDSSSSATDLATTAGSTAVDGGHGDDRSTVSPPSPPSPSSAPDATTASGLQPEGFTTVQAEITRADGEVCEVCLWLADDGDERGRGLMGVTDLGDAAGMAFRFDEPFRGAFYMFDTPTPLSIAWFAPDGAFVGSADMAPCLDTPAGDCPLYGPDDDYDLAVEAFDGGLEPLGLTAGSSIRLIDGSEADRCPLADT